MNEIGEELASARELSGVSLEEASNDLNIKVEMLENIEDGRAGAFKDVYELKDYISIYAKYLGLDEKKIIDEFNDYMFEYTSKIPIKEIEKTIELKLREEKTEEISSPYTKSTKKYKTRVYVLIYIVIFLLVILAIFWSVKQVTINKNRTDIISLGR